MITLKDVVWSDVELEEDNNATNSDDNVSVMTCCGYPPSPMKFTCCPSPPPIAPFCSR